MKKLISIIFIISVLFGCNKKELNKCDDDVVINKELYNQTDTENYNIEAVRIIDDCLEVEISSSGCNGNSWIIDLIDLGAISESNPIQRNLKIKLINTELCLGFITKRKSFHIIQLRTNDNQILLNLEGWDALIPYHY